MKCTSRVIVSAFLVLGLYISFSLVTGQGAPHVSGAGSGPWTPPSQPSGDASASDQNVETLELGPPPATGGFASIALTADYRHAAFVGPNGSRTSAFVDGRIGGKYDQIGTLPPVLSADGKHWAYTARKGNQWFMVIDDKEMGPYDSFPPIRRGGFGGSQPVSFQVTPYWPIVFSPDSKHSAFIAQKGTQSILVEDGKELPLQGQLDTNVNLLFSKQGDHLVCVLRGSLRDAISVVLDGVAGHVYQTIYRPQFSDDGRHLLYVGMKTPGKYTVVEDGKEGPVFDGIGDNVGGGILVSPDGAHVAYLARQSGGPGLVVIDGKIIPNAYQVWMAPNGKTIAYLTSPSVGDGASRVTMVINGKPGIEYGALLELRFAPDGHVIYTVRGGQQNKVFLIDGDNESNAYDDASLQTLHFSADGKHTAYVATVDHRSFVVLDGKKLPEFQSIKRPPALTAELAMEKMMQFTPDGHVVYYGDNNGTGSLVKDDQVLGNDGMVSPNGRRVASVKLSNQGTSDGTAQLTLDGQAGPVFAQITKVVFSPDSKHLAYVGVRPVRNGNDGGYFLMVDGVQKGEYPEVADVQFSSDSQHLFHFTTSHQHGGPGDAYMDQKLFATFYWLPGYFNVWLDDHRTFQILGGKEDKMFYRVRYFLPGADRKQESTVASTGTGAVNLQETRRMLGTSGGISGSTPAAAASAPSSAAPPAAAATTVGPGASGPHGTQIGIPAGTAVQVKMVDAVDSNSDPAGKQYRADVIRPVNLGNNVIIAQGSAAIVTLAKNGSGWIAQLSSVTINGQVVAVSSSSASMAGGAQNNAESATNAVRSILGGLGRRNNVPNVAQGVRATASGLRVVLPQGITLSFVLNSTPSASVPAPAAAPAAQPLQAATQPAGAMASSGSGGDPTARLVYCYSDPSRSPMYFSAPFEIGPSVNFTALVQDFLKFLMQKYSSSAQPNCLLPRTAQDNADHLKMLADFRLQKKVIDTGWRYGRPILMPGETNPVQLKDRQTLYFCKFQKKSLNATGGYDNISYVTDVFQAVWDNVVIAQAWDTSARTTYGTSPDGGYNAQCDLGNQQSHDQAILFETKYLNKVVQVSWQYTSAQVLAH